MALTPEAWRQRTSSESAVSRWRQFQEGQNEDRGAPSLVDQVRSTVFAMPAAIGHLGADAAQDVGALTQLPSALSLGLAAQTDPGADLVQAIHRNRVLRNVVGEEMVVDAARGEGFSEVFHEAFPLMGSIGTSTRETGERAVQTGASLAPGGLAPTDTQYAQASREGRIFPLVLEDVGNVALVAAGAGAAGGRLGTAASSRARSLARAAARAEAAAGGTAAPAAGAGARTFAVGAGGEATQVAGQGAAAAAERIALRAAAERAAAQAATVNRAAQGLRTFARWGDTVADAPARVFTWPAGRALRAAEPALGRFLETDAGQRVAGVLDERVRQPYQRLRERSDVQRTIRENRDERLVDETAEIVTPIRQADRLVHSDAAVSGAVSLTAAGVPESVSTLLDDPAKLEAVADALGLEDAARAREWIVRTVIGEDAVDAFEVADAYRRGELDPETASRLEEARTLVSEQVRAPSQGRWRRGEGLDVPQDQLGPAFFREKAEQLGDDPLSSVVQARVARLDAQIDQQTKVVERAREASGRADARRRMDPEAYRSRVRDEVLGIYDQARDLARQLADADPAYARRASGLNPRWDVSPEQVVEALAGRLVSSRGSNNPALRQLVGELEGAGWNVPFSLPNPSVLEGAGRAQAQVSTSRLLGRQATQAAGRAERAAAAAEQAQTAAQPVLAPRSGTTTALEAAARRTEPPAPQPRPRPEGPTAEQLAAERMGVDPARADLGGNQVLEPNVLEEIQGLYDEGHPFEGDEVLSGIYDEALARAQAEGGGGDLFDPENQRRARTDAEIDAEARQTRDDVATVARDAGAEVTSEMDRLFGGSLLERPPNRRRARRGVERMHGDDYVRPGEGDWTWFDRLDTSTQKWLRDRWMTRPSQPGVIGEQGLTFEQIGEAYARSQADALGEGLSDVDMGGIDFDAGMERFIEMAREADALDRLARGMGTRADFDLVDTRFDQLELGPAELDAYFPESGPRLRNSGQWLNEAKRNLRQLDDERLASERLGPDPSTEAYYQGRGRAVGPEPYELGYESWLSELDEVDQVIDNEARFPGSEPPARVRQAYLRWDELLPEGYSIDGVGADAPRATWESIVEGARRHGHFVPPDVDVDVPRSPGADPEAYALRAVDDAQARVADALEADQGAGGARRNAEGYQALPAGERRLYERMARQADQQGLQATLEQVRERTAQRIFGAGRRAQEPISRRVGRQEGRAGALGTEAARSERAASRAAEGAEGADVYGERTEALGRSLDRTVRESRQAGEAEARATDAARELGREERRLARLITKRLERQRAAEASPAAAPARFGEMTRARGQLRTAFEEARDQAVEAGMPDTVTPLLDLLQEDLSGSVYVLRELADPEHIISGDRTPRGTVAPTRTETGLGRVRKTGQQRRKSRERATGTGFELRDQGRAYIRRRTEQINNEAARAVGERFGNTRQELVDAGLIELPEDLQPSELVRVMRDQGYVPWDPASVLGRPARPIDPDTMWLSENVDRAARKMFDEESWEVQQLHRWYDRRLMGTIKTGWLALSPRWLTGNVVGNTLMATIGGGLDPITYVRMIGRARELLAEPPDPNLARGNRRQRRTFRRQNARYERGQARRAAGETSPHRALNRGFTREELEFMRPAEGLEPVGWMRRMLDATAGRSYRLNEYTDNLARSAIYLAKMEPRRKAWADWEAGRLTPEQFKAQVADTLSSDEALHSALLAAGDFTRMSNFERSVVRRLVPFYPWFRHITKLAFSLAVNHPMRVIWTLHLADMFGDSEEQASLPPFLQGSIPLGDDRYLPVGALNPFPAGTDSPFFSAQGMLRSTTPAVSWPAAILLGVDPGRGFERLTAPPGTYPLDYYGRETNRPLISDPSALGWWLGQQFPQTRTLTGLIADPVLRYDTGDPMRVGGQTIPNNRTRAGVAASFFGIPWPQTTDVEGIDQRYAERSRRAQAARERYFATSGR